MMGKLQKYAKQKKQDRKTVRFNLMMCPEKAKLQSQKVV